MLDVPMYFVYRDGKYIDASGQSFRAFLKGKLPARPGELPTINDWADHVTTAFPEVRLKRYLEMRGADGGSGAFIAALPALWVGLLYDSSALAAAWERVADWTADERQTLRSAVPVTGLATRFRDTDVREIARDILELARGGLARRGRRNAAGEDETVYLAPLFEVIESGKSSADRLLDEYETAWRGDIDEIFRRHAY
jgi:glutamate--cysteine ligase